MKKILFGLAVFGFLGLVSKAYPCGLESKKKEAFLSPAVAYAEEVEEKTLKVKGMKCSKCSRAVEKAAMKVDGVIEAKADYKTGTCKLKMKKGTDIQKIISAIEEAGYKVEGTM